MRFLCSIAEDAEKCCRATISVSSQENVARWANTTLKRILELRASLTTLNLMMYDGVDDGEE